MASKAPGVSHSHVHVPKISAPKMSASGMIREDDLSLAAMAAAAASGHPKGHGATTGPSKLHHPKPGLKVEKKSRQKAESKLQHMITNTGPELFVHGTLTDAKIPAGAEMHGEEFEGEVHASPSLTALAAVKPSMEDTSTCKEAAPFDMILEFMTAVMTREYEHALEIGKKIIKYEPDNKIVADFIPVLEEIAAFSDSEDETSNESSEESGTSSEESSSEEESESEDSEPSPSSSAESDENSESDGAKDGHGTDSSEGDSCTDEEDEEEDGAGSGPTSDAGYDSGDHKHKNMNQQLHNALKL